MDDARHIAGAGQQQSYVRHRDEVIAELAGRQFGRVARWQLLHGNVSSEAIRTRLKHGRLIKVRRGVYAVGHTAPSREARWWEAVLLGGEGAALAHFAGAAYWRLRDHDPAVVDVITPTRRRRADGVRFHHELLPSDEIDRTGLIPVTTAVRTCFDLAGDFRPHRFERQHLERAINEIEVRRLWTSLSLEDLLERHPRRPGAPVIREILAARRVGLTRTRNEFEADFVALLDEHGIPRPVTNTVIETAAGSHECDCIWRDEWLNVELDGRGAHMTAMAFERDRARDRALAVAGWQVLRVSRRQFEDDPAAIAADVHALLRARSNRRAA